MMDNVQPVEAGKSVADLSDCGRCVDLVGTGQTEGADVFQVNMNDCISSFFWRQIDLNMGAIEVFEDSNFRGNRSTIFLSEWDSGTIYPIDKWYLQDRISSVRWNTLADRQTAALFNNADGSGGQYDNIKGWGDTKEIANLNDIRFNDCMSSFRWDSIVPQKEVIAPFNVIAGAGSGSFGLTSVITGTNKSPIEQPVVLQLTKADAQSVTVAIMDQFVTGIEATYSSTLGNQNAAQTTWSVKLTASYTHSDTRTNSETTTISLSISETVNAPPNCTYKATLLVNIGKLPATLYHTTAERWYDEPVSGSQPDPLNNNWFKRVEPVTVSVEGSLASNTSINIESTPIH